MEGEPHYGFAGICFDDAMEAMGRQVNVVARRESAAKTAVEFENGATLDDERPFIVGLIIPGTGKVHFHRCDDPFEPEFLFFQDRLEGLASRRRSGR